jgi:Uma2 family endonuclease
MSLTIDRNKIEDLKHAPNLPLVVEELLSFLEDEKRRRKDFLENLNDDTKAEFIEGEIVLNSPVKRKHYVIVTNLLTLLSTYVSIHNLGELATEKVLIHLTRNDFEPDLVYFDEEQVKSFDRDTMLHPAPRLIVEVLSSSTQKYDRGIKFEDYANHKVKEYWIIDPDLEEVEQYVLNDISQYELKLKSRSGQITLEAIKNLTLNIHSFFNKAENLIELKKMMA